jgi:hypothetical protein
MRIDARPARCVDHESAPKAKNVNHVAGPRLVNHQSATVNSSDTAHFPMKQLALAAVLLAAKVGVCEPICVLPASPSIQDPVYVENASYFANKVNPTR